MSTELTVENIAVEVTRRLQDWIPAPDLMRRPDLERSVLGAILRQQLACDELPQLEAKHFSTTMHGAVWELHPQCSNIVTLAKALMERGYRDAAVYLAEYTPSQWDPVVSFGELAEAASEIRRLWWARHWHRTLVSCDLLVCAGGVTQDELLERLRAAAREAK